MVCGGTPLEGTRCSRLRRFALGTIRYRNRISDAFCTSGSSSGPTNTVPGSPDTVSARCKRARIAWVTRKIASPSIAGSRGALVLWKIQLDGGDPELREFSPAGVRDVLQA